MVTGSTPRIRFKSLMKTYLQTMMLFLLMLVCCVNLAAQCSDSVYFYALNKTLLTNIEQQQLLSSNKITIINFSKVKNKYLISVTQDYYREFARMFNVEFCTDSILGFFEIDNYNGILLGTNNPLIYRGEKQLQPIWFVEGYKEYVSIDTVSLTEPLYFTNFPIIHYFLITRKGRIIKQIGHREMKVSKDYYRFSYIGIFKNYCNLFSGYCFKSVSENYNVPRISDSKLTPQKSIFAPSKKRRCPPPAHIARYRL